MMFFGVVVGGMTGGLVGGTATGQVVEVSSEQSRAFSTYLRTNAERRNDDEGVEDACLGSRFPCDVAKEYCCFLIVNDYDGDGDGTTEDLDFSWCCSSDDGCGAYPYTCGDNSDLSPRLNITQTAVPTEPSEKPSEEEESLETKLF